MKREAFRLLACLVVPLSFFLPVGAEYRPPDVEKALQQKVPRQLIKAPLGEALVQYGKLSGLKIAADWEGLKGVGVTKDTPVLLRITEITVQQLLDLTVSDLSPKGHPLAWCVAGERIWISTQMRILHPDRLPERETVVAVAESPASPATTQPAERKPQGLGGLNFDNTPLGDVLSFLREVSGVNFHINWQAMKAVGVEPDTPVTLQVSGITIERALDLVTDQVSANRATMDKIYWLVDEGVVMISTGANLDTGVTTRVYDVGDMLIVTGNFRGPRMKLDVNTGSGQSGASSGGGGSGGSIFEDRGTEEGPTAAEQRKQSQDALTEIIRRTIGEDMWQPTGKGTITFLGNKMIISQTRLGFKLMERSIEKSWLPSR